jgi:hypothetical protein
VRSDRVGPSRTVGADEPTAQVAQSLVAVVIWEAGVAGARSIRKNEECTNQSLEAVRGASA